VQATQSRTGVLLNSCWRELVVAVVVALQQTSCLQPLLQPAEAPVLALARLEAMLEAETLTAVAAVTEAEAEACA
jgi:hypothetical protein